MKGERGGALWRLITILLVLAVCGVLYLLRAPILRFVANAWITEDAPQHSDAIIVLSDDNFEGQRAAHAAGLYQRGLAKEVVASGRRLRSYAGIAELIEHDLVQHGVPKKAIVSFPHTADSTKEEAEQLEVLVRQKGWKYILFVTSNVDVRRARYIFHRVMPERVEVRFAGSPDRDFDPNSWWESRRGVKRMFHEMAGMVVALWELRHRKDRREQSQFLVGLVPSTPQDVV